MFVRIEDTLYLVIELLVLAQLLNFFSYGSCFLLISACIVCLASSTGGELVVHVIPHSHCDPGYRKTFDQYFKENVNSTITTVLQALKVRWLFQ